MSFAAPTRRIALSASPLCRGPASLVQAHMQTRAKSSWSLKSLNPFASRKVTAPTAQNLDDPTTRKQLYQQSFAPKVEGSIFEEEVKTAQASEREDRAERVLDPSALVAGRDPDPRGRLRWQRAAVTNMILRRGAETIDDVIARTERTMTFKSPLMPTSTKKMMYLAQQIASKPLDDAMLQMRYSKKKMGPEIKLQLEEARDRAVAIYGMGLGKANGEAQQAKPRNIQDRNGTWRNIQDPSSLYIDQAWVNKGPKRSKRAIHLGRGRRVPILSHQASISVVLKEERTRIRLHDEKKAKKERKGPWVHLPHRPVSAQHQHYLW
ncbi:54S ribosomal protein L22 mitochondrial [Ceratocystis platani]|uniref:54S ribosomal protein L22 mitochondrial n=1 Tax=Ceratocystis fimbriata f. sp. platani TaxID=88771 RepID=A0A0F8B4V7_CERFI|nr:54S ribosomal protein L22 mitochondrial [Ceratocystis platani]